MSLNEPLLYSNALDSAIDRHPLIVCPETSIEEVLALMSQVRSSCPLPGSNGASDLGILHSVRASCAIVKEGAPLVCDQLSAIQATGKIPLNSTRVAVNNIGIFTERDIVRMTAAQIDLKSVKVADVMTSPVITITQSKIRDIFTALSLFRQHRIRHLPLVDEAGHLLGILTPETIRQALQPVSLLTKLRYVRDVMSASVINASLNASVLDLAQLMADNQVSCVVICRDLQGKTHDDSNTTMPVGIVTERDIVQFKALELDLGKMKAHDVMSSPLFSLSPDDSLWFAHEEMQRRHVRRLVVCGSAGELLGIVSQTSLLHALDPTEMYGAIETLQQAVEERTTELKEANAQLQKEIEERKRAEAALQEAHDNLQRLVEERTAELQATNARLHQDISDRKRVEAALRESEGQLRQQAKELEAALHELQQTQFQLIQAEKMSSLGQLVAGVAHEINNPVNFIYGNLAHATQYIKDLLQIVNLYQKYYPKPVEEIEDKIEDIDLDFLIADLPKLLSSMQIGADRIRAIVLSLRNFSRLDEAEMKRVDIHEGLDSTLMILQHRFKDNSESGDIEIHKEYGELPMIDCYVGPLNQVFMNIISNAIDALEGYASMGHRAENHLSAIDGPHAIHHAQAPTIWISTSVSGDRKYVRERPTNQGNHKADESFVTIRIADNGPGMSEEIRRRLFEPFFTTKPVGTGTGLGLSISYQIIVEKHRGRLECISAPGEGTEFVIEIPLKQPDREPPLFKQQTLS